MSHVQGTTAWQLLLCRGWPCCVCQARHSLNVRCRESFSRRQAVLIFLHALLANGAMPWGKKDVPKPPAKEITMSTSPPPASPRRSRGDYSDAGEAQKLYKSFSAEAASLATEHAKTSAASSPTTKGFLPQSPLQKTARIHSVTSSPPPTTAATTTATSTAKNAINRSRRAFSDDPLHLSEMASTPTRVRIELVEIPDGLTDVLLINGGAGNPLDVSSLQQLDARSSKTKLGQPPSKSVEPIHLVLTDHLIYNQHVASSKSADQQQRQRSIAEENRDDTDNNEGNEDVFERDAARRKSSQAAALVSQTTMQRITTL